MIDNHARGVREHPTPYSTYSGNPSPSGRNPSLVVVTITVTRSATLAMIMVFSSPSNVLKIFKLVELPLEFFQRETRPPPARVVSPIRRPSPTLCLSYGSLIKYPV